MFSRILVTGIKSLISMDLWLPEYFKLLEQKTWCQTWRKQMNLMWWFFSFERTRTWNYAKLLIQYVNLHYTTMMPLNNLWMWREMSLPFRNYFNDFYAILSLPGSITLQFKLTTNQTTLCSMMGDLVCVKVMILFLLS